MSNLPLCNQASVAIASVFCTCWYLIIQLGHPWLASRLWLLSSYRNALFIPCVLWHSELPSCLSVDTLLTLLGFWLPTLGSPSRQISSYSSHPTRILILLPKGTLCSCSFNPHGCLAYPLELQHIMLGCPSIGMSSSSCSGSKASHESPPHPAWVSNPHSGLPHSSWAHSASCLIFDTQPRQPYYMDILLTAWVLTPSAKCPCTNTLFPLLRLCFSVPATSITSVALAVIPCAIPLRVHLSPCSGSDTLC